MEFGLQKLGLLSLECDVVKDLDGDIEGGVLAAEIFEQGELALIEVAKRRRRSPELRRILPTCASDREILVVRSAGL